MNSLIVLINIGRFHRLARTDSLLREVAMKFWFFLCIFNLSSVLIIDSFGLKETLIKYVMYAEHVCTKHLVYPKSHAEKMRPIRRP